MALLGKDDILRAKDTVTEDVDVPEWGGTVRVKALSGLERDRWEQSLLVETKQGSKTVLKPDMANARAKLCALCIVDEKGNRVFSPDDVQLLGNKSGAALDRVYDVAQRLSGLSPEDVEDLAGNSEATTSGGSATA